ncbi:zinc-binding protein A33-like [Lissotriton helveticus]
MDLRLDIPRDGPRLSGLHVTTKDQQQDLLSGICMSLPAADLDLLLQLYLHSLHSTDYYSMPFSSSVPLYHLMQLMVTLDPDTAYPWLLLSEGRRRVRWMDTEQPLPDTPKRFIQYYCVLGSKGFTAGRHYWEVQLLQEGKAWHVGVTVESVNRKGHFTWSPEGGVWAVSGWKGHYKALTSPQTPLSPREKPLKLGVYLDYEGGQLSLYNADSWELLYTFPQATFTERLFPYFYLWGGAELRLV